MLRVASVLALLGMLTDAHPLLAAPWNPLASLPAPRTAAAAAATADRIYVVGGMTDQPIGLVTMWDGTAWVEAPPMLRTRAWPAAAASGGSVFAFGGVDLEGFPTDGAERLAAGVWAGIAPMPGARFMQSAVSIQGVIYVVGGRNDGYQAVADCFAYDVNSGTWTTTLPMPTARFGAAAATLGGQRG